MYMKNLTTDTQLTISEKTTNFKTRLKSKNYNKNQSEIKQNIS